MTTEMKEPQRDRKKGSRAKSVPRDIAALANPGIFLLLVVRAKVIYVTVRGFPPATSRVLIN